MRVTRIVFAIFGLLEVPYSEIAVTVQGLVPGIRKLMLLVSQNRLLSFGNRVREPGCRAEFSR